MALAATHQDCPSPEQPGLPLRMIDMAFGVELQLLGPWVQMGRGSNAFSITKCLERALLEICRLWKKNLTALGDIVRLWGNREG